jgi:hypothetical protein
VPAASRRVNLHLRRGLGVEITLAEAGFTVPGLDEALAFSIERGGVSFPGE